MRLNSRFSDIFPYLAHLLTHHFDHKHRPLRKIPYSSFRNLRASILLVSSLALNTPAQNGCSKCTRELDASSPFDRALIAYTSAVTRGDWITAGRYVARFRFEWNRKRVYRSRSEQQKLLSSMQILPIQAFHLCFHATSTEEFNLPSHKRTYTIFGCIEYLELGESKLANVLLAGYREGAGWVFGPLTAPERKIPPVPGIPRTMTIEPPPRPPL